MTTTDVVNDAVEFWPPAVKTAPYGLFHHVNWWPEARDEAQDETDSAVDLQELPNAQEHYRPAYDRTPMLTALEQGRGWCDSDLDPHADRFLLGGVRFRTFNYGESSSTGTWDGPWCSTPTYPPSQTKGGTRPGFPANYEPVTAWAFDMCDLTPYSFVETQMHAQQWLRLTAPIAVEAALASRMLTDAGTLPSAVDFTTALGQLENAIGQTNTVGYIHAAPALASAASRSSQLVRHPDGTLTTHLGNVFVFGGGYVSTLGTTIIATSALYGWRNEPQLRTTVEQRYNTYAAVCEQSYVIGYEQVLGAAVHAPA